MKNQRLSAEIAPAATETGTDFKGKLTNPIKYFQK